MTKKSSNLLETSWRSAAACRAQKHYRSRELQMHFRFHGGSSNSLQATVVSYLHSPHAYNSDHRMGVYYLYSETMHDSALYREGAYNLQSISATPEESADVSQDYNRNTKDTYPLHV